jgi:ferric-dicitrate binding protein FerR (iron transport regulator)
MQTGHHHEPTEGWREVGVTPEEWERLEHLLALVREEHLRTELSAERREQIRERVMARLEKNERRRRRWRMFAFGAGGALLAGVALRFVSRATR